MMSEETLETVDKIISSAVDRTVHSDALRREITDIIGEVVPTAIKVNVNGKIDGLRNTFDAFAAAQETANEKTAKTMNEHMWKHAVVDGKQAQTNEKVEAFIEQQTDYNAGIRPVLQGIDGSKVFGKVLLWIIGILIAVASAITIINTAVSFTTKFVRI